MNGDRTDVEAGQLEGDEACGRLSQLAGEPRPDVDRGAELRRDGFGVEGVIGEAGDEEAVARDEQRGGDPGPLAVGLELADQGIDVVAHGLSRAVVSWDRSDVANASADDGSVNTRVNPDWAPASSLRKMLVRGMGVPDDSSAMPSMGSWISVSPER